MAQAELYRTPKSPEARVYETLSLFTFGDGLSGFPGILHGGMISVLFDEALAMPYIFNDWRQHGGDLEEWAIQREKNALNELTDIMVTAELHVKYRRPVRCPGAVGVFTTVVEDTGDKIRVTGVMKDANEKVCATADGLWLRTRPRNAKPRM